MASAKHMHRPHNPFRSANIRPQPERFLTHADAAWNPDQLDRLVREMHVRRHCQIVGPHGSGKSTLVAELVQHLRQQPLSVDIITWNGRSRWQNWRRLFRWHLSRHRRNQLFIIDGFEQLPWSVRSGTRLRWAGSPAMILVTSHHDAGFFELYRSEVDFQLVQRVVENLLVREGCPWRPSVARLQQLVDQHQANVRELLFALHEDYRQAIGQG